MKDFSLPTSKSMAARALIISALADKTPDTLRGLPDCSDSSELSKACYEYFSILQERDNNTSTSELKKEINLGLGGTSLRFFTALAASTPGVEFTIDCAPQLKKRPIKTLCDALIAAGANISYPEKEGTPPLLINGSKMPGGKVEIPADISSQFISALMMCAPYWENGLELHLTGNKTVSFPYIEMTTKMMRRAGAKIEILQNHITVKKGGYSLAKPLTIEADWSAAGFFYEYALLAPGEKILLKNLTAPKDSIQGDSRCAEIFAKFGVESSFSNDDATLCYTPGNMEIQTLDMTDTPDLVPALAVGLCFAGIPFKFTGIQHLHLKECDRIAALEAELKKLGFLLDPEDAALSWCGKRCQPIENPAIETYSDHRIAMSFGIVAHLFPELNITIANPEVVRKSFPDFFSQISI